MVLTARRGFATVVVLALLLASFLGVSWARGNKGVGRSAAARAALRALGARTHTGPEIVFGLRSPVPAGTVVRAGGPSRPAVGVSAVSSRAPTVARTSGAAWFFYEDQAPFQQYSHAGRVALVDMRSGRVRVSRTLAWPPSVNGRLPAFLSSIAAYGSHGYRVFYRPYTGAGGGAAAHLARAARLALADDQASLDPAHAARLGALLAADHACTVRVSDSLPGGYYAYAWISQSRTALDFRFTQLAANNPGFRSFIYSRASGLSPTAFIARQIARYGCKDVLLYLAGGGYRGATAVNVGMRLAGRDVSHEDLTAAELRRLIGSHRHVDFELLLDAPHASGFQHLGRLANVLEVATPAAPGGGSFTYLPEARVNGRLIANDTNPRRLLQFTDRLVFGFDRVVDSSCEVSQAESLRQAGKLPSLLAYLFARGFDRGGAVDFVANAGVGSPPDIRTHGFTAVGCPAPGPAPGPAPVVTVSSDSYASTNAAVLSVDAGHGLLANDSDSAHHPLIADQLNATGGSAPFHGTSSKGAAVTLAADGSFTYDPTGSPTLQALGHGQSTTDTFSYRASDGQGGSDTGTVTITVTGANHAPVAAGVTVAGVSEDGFKTIGLSADDAEGDGLTFSGGSGPAHGTLGSITGTSCSGTPSHCTASVVYTPDANYNGADSFTYKANDGFADSTAAVVSITVDPVNDAPKAQPGSATLNEDTATVIDLRALVSDVETSNANLTYTIVAGPAHGGLSGAGPSPTYTPNAHYNGTDSFTYNVTDRGDPDNCSGGPPACDAAKTSATETVSLTINPVNDPPSANDSSVSLNEDATKSIDLGALVSDVETSNANLAISIQGPPAHGTLSGGVYTPAANYNGPDSFVYRVTDRGDPDNCGAPSATCDAPRSVTAMVSITVDPVNDPPVNTVPSGTLKPVQDTATPIMGIAVSDIDAAADPVQLTLSVGHGTLTLNTLVFAGVTDAQVSGNGTAMVVATAPLAALNATLADAQGLVYHGTAGYTGPDTLTVTSDDLGHTGAGGPLSDTGTVALQVVPANNPPVAGGQSVSTNEDTAKTITLSASDTDGPQDLTFAIATAPAHGALGSIGGVTCDHASPNTCTADVTYMPAANYNGPDSFRFTANDGLATSTPASVSITVGPLNDAPVAGAGSASATEDTAGSIDLTGFASDVGTNPANLIYTIVTGPAHGSLTGSGASRTYTPAANYNGLDSFTYQVTDRGDPDNCGTAGPGCAAAKTSSAGTVSITVNPVNDAPTASDGSLSTNEDQSGTVDLGTLVSDVETGDANLTYEIVTGPAHGQLSANSSSQTYAPDANFNGTDSFTYRVTDRGDPDNCSGGPPACDAPKSSATRTISITVAPVNDPPALQDTEGGTLAYTENDPATQITATTTVSDIDSSNFDTGTLTVDYSTGATVDDRLAIANQGTGAGQIGISGATITFAGATIGTFAGGSGTTALVVTLNANADPAATQALVRAITYSNVSDNPSTAARTVRFVLTDGDGGTSAPATRAIALAAVNDPPTLAGIEATAVNYVESVDSPPSQSQITNSLTVGDPDNTNLAGASVQITTACQPSEDVLVFANQNGITGTYTPATCLLTLTGSSSLANYQEALRSVKYETTSDTPNTTTRTVTFQVDDGQAANHASNPQARDLTVTAANDSPSGVADTFNGTNSALAGVTLAVSTSASTPNVAITGNLLSNDTDPDTPHANLTAVAGTSSAQGGIVAVNSDGTFSYTPAPGFTGTDTFTYTVHDHGSPDRTSGATTVTINVAGPRVWFVNPGGSAGNGTSASPLNSLAPLSASGASDSLDGNGDVIFVYQGSGNATSSGFALEGNQRLVGQPQGLSVTDSLSRTFNLVAAGGANPTITNNAGAGLTLADGNTIQRINVTGAAGVGVTGTGINTLSYGASTTISGNAGGGLALTGAAGGAVSVGADISTSAGHSVSIANRTSGTTTLSGAINDTGTGISLSSNTGATLNLSGGVTASTGTNAAFAATGGGTVTVPAPATGTNTLITTTGTALNVTNTTIGGAGMTFMSISANGAGNGIVLNGTGASGALTVTGNGNSTVGGDSSGGTIQNTTGHGISLNSTTSPSFTNMNIQSTGGAGINGTNVTNFTFANGTINSSGDALGESNIAFNGNGTLTGNNINGTLSVTNSVLTNAFDSGIHAENNAGTISNATITGNTFTSTTSTTTSKGDGVRLVGTGTAATAGTLTKATITGNTIAHFPVGGGIQVNYGNANTTGPGGGAGTPGNATNIITIANNTIRGASAANRMNTSAIIFAISGGNTASRAQGNANIFCNGNTGTGGSGCTATGPLTNMSGTAILIGNNGSSDMTAVVDKNTIVANNTVGSQGIGGGNGVVTATGTETPHLTLAATNNNISQTDGNGILLVGRGTAGQADLSIKNNTVAAPLSGVRPGIRVDAGNAASHDDAVCLDISGNTTAGSDSGGTISAGIGLRKQGTVSTTNDFGIEGMAATSSPGVEQYVGNAVGGKNPGSANGVSDGSNNGVLLISAASGFSNCNTAP